MAETRALRSDAGASCTGLTSPLLLGAAQSSTQTQLLASGVEHAWTVAETAREIAGGNFTVTLNITTGGPNQASPNVRVRVEHRNSSCVVQSTIIDETISLSNGTTQDYTWEADPEGVTFAEGDRLVVIVNRVNSSNRTATLNYAGSSPNDSRLVHPDEAEAPGETAEGGSETTVTAAAEGAGTAARSGSSETTVSTATEGSGSTTRFGAAEATVTVTTEGAGEPSGGGEAKSGGSEASVSVSVEGSGTPGRSGGSDASVTVTAEGDGFGSTAGAGGSTTTIAVTPESGGVTARSAASETTVTASAEGASSTARFGGSETTVSVTSEGAGTGEEPPAAGGSETAVTVTAEGAGWTSRSGGSEASVVVTVTSGGNTFAGDPGGKYRYTVTGAIRPPETAALMGKMG